MIYVECHTLYIYTYLQLNEATNKYKTLFFLIILNKLYFIRIII